MSKQRLNRLKNEYERLVKGIEGNDCVEVVETKGDPPYRYTFAYHLKGVTLDRSTGQPSFVTRHGVEITLLRDYPKSAPYCKVLTEIFHPNISSTEISVRADGAWSPGDSLLSIVKRIGRMISYQDYNLTSPLNAEAAQWAAANKSSLPVDSTDRFTEGKAGGDLQDEWEYRRCTYCLEPDANNECDNGHLACDACVTLCKSCGNITCLACAHNTCSRCRGKIEEYCSQIDAFIERGKVGNARALAEKALEKFEDADALRRRLDKAERISNILGSVIDLKQLKCYYGIAKACEELRSLGIQDGALDKLKAKALKKLEAADRFVAEGKTKLHVDRAPQIACKHFSAALKIVADHPQGNQLLKTANKQMVEARGHIECAEKCLAEGRHDLAVDSAKKASSIEHGLSQRAKELVQWATLGQCQVKTRRLSLVTTIAASVVLILTGFLVWQHHRLKGEYQTMLQSLDNEPSLEAKVESLSSYILSHKADEFTKSAEEKMKAIRGRIQVRDYEIAESTAEAFIEKSDFENALITYEQCLDEYPDAPYGLELAKKITELRYRVDEADYEKLGDVAASDVMTRMARFDAYLAKHPEGKYRGEVGRLFLAGMEACCKTFKKDLAQLKNSEAWDQCIRLCEEMGLTLERWVWPDEMQETRNQYRSVLDLERKSVSLIIEAEGKGDNYEAARGTYLHYLEENEDSPLSAEIRDRIAAMGRKLQSQKEWEKKLAYVTSEENDLNRRLTALQEYLALNPEERYAKEATKVLRDLEQAKDAMLWEQIVKRCKDAQVSIESKVRCLQDYVSKNPSGQYVLDAKARLRGLKREEKDMSWKKVASYCRDPRIPISDRIHKVKDFIDRNSSGDCVEEAKATMARLTRFRTEEQAISERITEIGNTYLYRDGAIIDKRTGLMWCAFDSYIEFQQCLSYQSGNDYLASVNHGGYRDWRLPSEEELQFIYKNEPFFPTSHEGKWYWTSASHGGYMVPVVTTERTTRLQTAEIEATNGCGSFRAVRGP